MNSFRLSLQSGLPDHSLAGERTWKLKLVQKLSIVPALPQRGPNDSVYSYFVRRGHIVARVDIRGTGNIAVFVRSWCQPTAGRFIKCGNFAKISGLFVSKWATTWTPFTPRS